MQGIFAAGNPNTTHIHRVIYRYGSTQEKIKCYVEALSRVDKIYLHFNTLL